MDRPTAAGTAQIGQPRDPTTCTRGKLEAGVVLPGYGMEVLVILTYQMFIGCDYTLAGFQRCCDKLICGMKSSYGLNDQIDLRIGDDLIDIPVMRRAGISVAPADGVSQLDEFIDWRTTRRGGDGVLYEVISRLLAERGELEQQLDYYRVDS